MSMTLKEISEQTGYSIATVSRALRGINCSKKSKSYSVITDFAREHGFLTPGQSNLVAMVVPDISNPISTAVFKAAQKACDDSGLFLLAVNTSEDTREENLALQALAKMDLYGLIYSPAVENESQDFAVFQENQDKKKIPVVLMSRGLAFATYDFVCINNIAGAFDATCYLLQKGITDIAVIAGPQDTKPGRERLEGFYNAYRYCGIAPPPPERIRYGDFTTASGFLQTQALLREQPLPQAFFPMNNLMTRGCLKAMIDARVPIGAAANGPELISFDGDELLDVVAPDAPYVSRPVEELGRMAVELLIARAGQKNSEAVPFKHIELTPVLKIRGNR